LHNEELHDFYSSPNIIWVTKSKRMRWVGHVACMGEKRSLYRQLYYGNAYRVLVGKPDGKRPLVRCGHRWEDNIKVDLKETGWKMWTGFIWPRAQTNGGLL
jgi:hypothetical protein